MSDEYSPVPFDQQPLQEFIKLSNSWFFILPLSKKKVFYIRLIIIWFSSSVIYFFIGSGSYYLSKHIIELFIVSLIYSLSIPIIILFRQYLGWGYIYRRLISKIVEYEESDWHDGQRWEKTIAIQQKDLLIAKLEVRPTIQLLKNSMINVIILFIISLTAYIIFIKN